MPASLETVGFVVNLRLLRNLIEYRDQTAIRSWRWTRATTVSGIRNVRYLRLNLAAKFHRDLRLVAAAYYVGEHAIAMSGLNYANPDVVAYVASIRERIERQRKLRSTHIQSARGRTQ
jgi:hypothetical protein